MNRPLPINPWSYDMLDCLTLILGPVSTNCYIIADSDTGEAAVIDPAWDGQNIFQESQKRGWKIGQLWYTHAHFDHFGGAAALAKALNPTPMVALHPLDNELWQNQGGAPYFGMQIEPGPEPTVDLAQGQILRMGKMEFEVRHTPGHTPGHVVFYCAKESVLFCGDLIFHNGVGRTDLPGGDWEALTRSITEQVFTLTDETQLLSGHGEKSTVGEEKRGNPFVGT
jgi:glyoxylase-like metal-dependent hydrolase (beta-lactamase superfamily II)